ncbi:MAG: hypothetical protein RIC95_10460 [Vicingaceae bacterium]
MTKTYSFPLFFLLCLSFSSFAQKNWYEQEEEKKKDTNRFTIGVNLAAYFPNQNTAVLYNGSPNVTNYGVEFVFAQQVYQQRFNDYFQHPYEVVEYPLDPRYQTGFELGLHLGYKFLPRFNGIFDFNLTQLDYERTFTVAIQDPNNGIPGPTYQQFPIIGEENRFFLNLGTQYEYFQAESSAAYLAVFAHANNIQMQDNYFVVNDQQYNIFHFNPNTSNQRAGGNAVGFGGGTGYKFKVYDRWWGELMYNFYYSEIQLTELITEKGLQHSAGIRVYWK